MCRNSWWFLLATRALSSKMVAIYSLGFLQDEDIKRSNHLTSLKSRNTSEQQLVASSHQDMEHPEKDGPTNIWWK
jgi:hypothetical protein